MLVDRTDAHRAADPEGVDQDSSGQRLDSYRGGKHQVKMTKPGERPITLPENKRPRLQQGVRGGAPAPGGSLTRSCWTET